MGENHTGGAGSRLSGLSRGQGSPNGTSSAVWVHPRQPTVRNSKSAKAINTLLRNPRDSSGRYR